MNLHAIQIQISVHGNPVFHFHYLITIHLIFIQGHVIKTLICSILIFLGVYYIPIGLVLRDLIYFYLCFNETTLIKYINNKHMEVYNFISNLQLAGK